MAHKCVHCGLEYDDGASQITTGCTCGSKFFFYLTDEKLRKIKEQHQTVVQLTTEEKEHIEEEVRELIGVDEEEETPIVLDFESVKLLKPGKYVIDVQNLFKKDHPRVYTFEEGKYVIDLSAERLPKNNR